jgi:hypothetical protein
MLRRVALLRTDISDELSASIIRVTRIGELGTTLAVTSNRRTVRRNRVLTLHGCIHSSLNLVTLMMDALSSSETLVRISSTRLKIPEDATLHSHRRENLKPNKSLRYCQ